MRVVTNGLTVIQALAGVDGIELVALGGMLRPVSGSLVGPMRRPPCGVSQRRVFLGADGIVAGRGICEATDEQT